MDRGACRSEDPELFFPISSYGDGEHQVRRAVSVCHDCSVRRECLSYALAERLQDGVWGGLTEQERLAVLRRERAR
ncbi:WhiB family transcriptional regulator [Actinomadura sp. HBU206391]|nr:WhiB family transcriptional regulator [Actinomadura sp. HBU206391]